MTTKTNPNASHILLIDGKFIKRVNQKSFSMTRNLAEAKRFTIEEATAKVEGWAWHFQMEARNVSLLTEHNDAESKVVWVARSVRKAGMMESGGVYYLPANFEEEIADGGWFMATVQSAWAATGWTIAARFETEAEALAAVAAAAASSNSNVFATGTIEVVQERVQHFAATTERVAAARTHIEAAIVRALEQGTEAGKAHALTVQENLSEIATAAAEALDVQNFREVADFAFYRYVLAA